MGRRGWVTALCIVPAAAAAPARASDEGGAALLAPSRFEMPQPGSGDGVEPGDTALAGGTEHAVAVFGAADTCWWTVGADLSWASGGSTDSALHGSFSYFIAQDVELAAELGLWNFNQPGDNAVGLSASMVFRWHFINTGDWTVYADAGIGVLGATDEVPDGGTSFDLMPRAGGGFTRKLTDDGLRLQVGLRWHHVSNARIFGDSNNPARDQALVYVGLIFPF